ncbi:hypothetical protein SRHO_G00098890 [Serrasalmus rhombeus]
MKPKHPSIHFLSRFSIRVAGGAGAYPSSLRAEGRRHPGQVASPSQGRQTDTDSHSHIQKPKHPSIHPFSKPLLRQGRGGVLEPIPAVFGRKAGYTLDRSPVHRRADRQTQTVTHTLTPRGNSACPIGLTACLWTVGGNRRTRRKPTQTRGEHANSTQRGPWLPGRGIEPRPSLL